MIALIGQTVSTLLLATLGRLWVGKVPIVLVGLLLAGWGIFGWAFNPPSQMRLMKVAGDAATEAVALNTSAMYVGIAIAGLLGGTMLATFGATGVLATSAALGLLTIAIFALSFRTGRGEG